MTRQHFEAIAAKIRDERLMTATYVSEPARSEATAAIDRMARGIADVCQLANAQFDRSRFLAACGVTS